MEKDAIFTLIAMAGFILLVVGAVLVIYEFHGAQSFCSKQNGTSSFDFSTLTHYCDNQSLMQYVNATGSFWNYQEYNKINVSSLSAFNP